MNPLIGLAIALVPELLQLFAGDKTGQIGKKVANAVADVTKTSSPEEAAKKVYDDPKIKADLQIQLAQIALAAQKAAHEDAQSERDAAYKEDVLANVSTAGARQQAAELAKSNPLLAYTPAVLSYLVVAGFLILLGMMALGHVKPDTLNNNNVIQVFNILIGALAAQFATVMNFWLGSSLSSSRKSVALEQAVQSQQSDDGGKRPGGRSGPQDDRPPPPPPDTGPAAEQGSSKSVTPARHGLLSEIVPELTKAHHHFPNGVAWALTPDGIAIDGAKARGTGGEPSTVRNIWKSYGPLCASAARTEGVPVELIVATIATESRGDPNARRSEPKVRDESVGLMQTLVGTARAATGRQTLVGDDLLKPANSIDAGTAYIAGQRGSTHFDPPLVAAAYNAGSVKRDNSDANRWKLVCYPTGTGQHVDRFVAWFSDCMEVSAADDWSAKNTVPSFAAELSGRTHGPGTQPSGEPQADRFGPGFPPPPSFRPLLDLASKQKLFGTFTFVAAPQPDNPEHIRITDDWVNQNIVKVAIPIRGLFGKPLAMDFHKLAEQQLKDLWVEWEKEGLLDRVVSFDGAFVPRFQRGSTRTLSNHAFGTAFDINATFNPLKQVPALVGQQGSVRELVQIANKFGFFWGGCFHPPRVDGMHFEVAVLKESSRTA